MVSSSRLGKGLGATARLDMLTFPRTVHDSDAVSPADTLTVERLDREIPDGPTQRTKQLF